MAGGGTGGHFYPALAISEGLKQQYPDAQIEHVGTRTGVEAKVLKEHPWIRFRPIHASGLHRTNKKRNVLAAAKIALGFLETLWIFLRFRPQLVIGVGGYSSFAPVLLGALLGRILPIRTMIHEQNVIGGLANRWLSRVVDVVMLSFEDSKRSFPHARRIAVTGNPIREEFLHVKRSDAVYAHFGLDPNRRTILVFGGSKGSEEITEQILAARRAVAASKDLQILLITGKPGTQAPLQQELENAGVRNIIVRDYVHHMGAAFAVSDLVVCRSGATSLAEITSCGKASILLPWREATDDHQSKNAQWMQAENACAVADEESIVQRGLVGMILEQVEDELTLSQMAENAKRLGRADAETLILGEIRSMMREVGA